MFHTSRGFASREAAFPRYRHVLPPPGAGALRRNVRGPTCGTGEIPGSNRVRAHTPLSRETGARGAPGHGFPLGIALTAPAPRGGGGGRRPGGVGMPERNFWVTFCPGRGRAPSPVPSPRGDSHHGPVYRDKPGKPGSGSLLPRETAASTTPAEGTEGSAPWGMGRRPDRACSSGIDAVVPFGAGSRETLSGGTTSQHLHRDCAGGYPSGSVIAWRK